MRKKRNWWTFTVLPLYAFTLIFVAGPLVYMIALSFASNREGYGLIWRFTALVEIGRASCRERV